MKKINALLAISGWFFVMAGMLLKLFHLHPVALYLTYVSVYIFIICILISLIVPQKIYPPLLQYNQRFNSLRRILLYISNIGGLVALSGPVIHQFHLHGSRQLLIWGIIIIMFNFSLLGILTANKKKYYFIPISEPGIDIDDITLQSYAGVYFSEALQKSMTISIDGQVMFAQLSGQDSFTLAAVKETVFNNLQFGVVLEFNVAQNEMVLVQKGKYIPFLRTT